MSMPYPEPSYALSSPFSGIFSLVLYTALVLLLIAVVLFLADRLGKKRPNAEKSRPYECGIIPSGIGRQALPVPFYLVALFFLIFDVEGAYIFSWAIAFRDLGWRGWCQVTFFIAMLVASLIYIWAKGGLEWKKERPEKSP